MKIKLFISVLFLLTSFVLSAEDYTIDGKLGVGVEQPEEMLEVDGSIKAEGILVDQVNINDDYNNSNYINPNLIRFLSNSDSVSIERVGNKLFIYFSIGNDEIKTVFTKNGLRIGKEEGVLNQNDDYPLVVDGAIVAKELQIFDEDNWPDYVFTSNYKLRTLDEVEHYINENGKLPEVPSESEVTENGVNVGEMQKVLLKKIEELTLYIIDLEKQNEELEDKFEQIKNK